MSNNVSPSNKSTKSVNNRFKSALLSNELPSRNFIYDINKLIVPKQKLFQDMQCTTSLDINLNNWLIDEEVIKEIARECRDIKKLHINHSIGLLQNNLKYIKGFKQLNTLTLRKTLIIDSTLSKILGSLPALTELDISENTIDLNGINTLCLTCTKLKSIVLQCMKGLNDSCLLQLASLLYTHQRLTKIDLNGSLDFTDEGILSLLSYPTNTTTGTNNTNTSISLTSLSISNCTNLTSLAFTGFRYKNNIQYLYMNSLNMKDRNIYEWISEGCNNIIYVDFKYNNNIDDYSLLLLGKKCIHITTLLLTKCQNITNTGIRNFFSYFFGSLKHLDISSCINCSNESIDIISKHSNGLLELKINDLSNILDESINKLLNNVKNLQIYEMNINMNVLVNHRYSLVSHLSNNSLTNITSTFLIEVSINNSILITDIGILGLLKRCNYIKKLDIGSCIKLTDQSIYYISKYLSKSIVYLNLTNIPKLTDVSIENLTSNCKKLTYLNLCNCQLLSDVSVSTISRLVKLEYLNLSHCFLISNQSILDISTNCILLKHLHLNNCSYITYQCIKSIICNCLYIQVLNCNHCNISPNEFNRAVNNQLALSRVSIGKCQVEPREKCIIAYNNFILELIRKETAARVLQKLCKGIYNNYFMIVTRLLKKEAVNNIKRIFNVRTKNKQIIKKKISKNKQIIAARKIQKQAKKFLGILYAKKKLLYLRSTNRAANLIQRVYRGRMCRKRYYRKLNNYKRIYKYINHYFNKYIVIKYYRILKHKLVKLLYWVKMIIRRMKFKILKKGIKIFQKYIRYYNKRKALCKLIIHHTIDTIIKREKSIRVIQKFFRAMLFNKSMSSYVLYCALYYKSQIDFTNWYVIMIQKYYRRYIDFKKYQVIIHRNRYINQSIKTIKRFYIKYKNNYRHKLNNIRLNKILNNWIILFNNRNKLLLGKYIKVIQRLVRLFLFKRQRIKAAIIMQKYIRRYLNERKYFILLLNYYNNKAGVIQYYTHIYIARKFRKLLIKRQHMAAYKIQTFVRKTFDLIAIRKLNKFNKSVENKKLNEIKKQIYESRQINTISNIRQKFDNLYASRIQRKIRQYLANKHKKQQEYELEQQKLKERELQIYNDNIIQYRKNIIDSLHLNTPIKIFNRIGKMLYHNYTVDADSIDMNDTKRLRNAVLKYQTQTILQEGITELYVTYGEGERAYFQELQEKARQEKRDYFHMLPNDISGYLDFQIYLWVIYGSGRECICELEIKKIPGQQSINWLKSRLVRERGHGIKLGWNPKMFIEFRGICLHKQGKPGFSIRDIKILPNNETEAEVKNLLDNEYTCAGNLDEFGFATSVYVLNRTLVADDELYDLGVLNVRPWMNKRLLKHMKTYNLSESDVMRMREIFESLTKKRGDATIRVKSFLDKIKQPKTKIVEWVIDAINPTRDYELYFHEYVHLVCYYPMLSSKELTKFLYGCMDEEKNRFLKKDQFLKFMEYLAEGGLQNPISWQAQFKNFQHKQLGYFFLEDFEKFVLKNPTTIFRAQELQRFFMRLNLGEAYWEKKMNQFRIIREDMGILLVT